MLTSKRWQLVRYLIHFYGFRHAIRVLACAECEKPDINALWRCASHKLESFDLLARREL